MLDYCMQMLQVLQPINSADLEEAWMKEAQQHTPKPVAKPRKLPWFGNIFSYAIVPAEVRNVHADHDGVAMVWIPRRCG